MRLVAASYGAAGPPRPTGGGGGAGCGLLPLVRAARAGQPYRRSSRNALRIRGGGVNKLLFGGGQAGAGASEGAA